VQTRIVPQRGVGAWLVYGGRYRPNSVLEAESEYSIISSHLLISFTVSASKPRPHPTIAHQPSPTLCLRVGLLSSHPSSTDTKIIPYPQVPYTLYLDTSHHLSHPPSRYRKHARNQSDIQRFSYCGDISTARANSSLLRLWQRRYWIREREWRRGGYVDGSAWW
jgi:hypothetical protein